MNAPADFPKTCEQLHACMIAFDTVNERYTGRKSGESALAAYLETLAQSWGLHTQRLALDNRDAFNLFIGTAPLAANGDWLLFDSHLDTVSIAGMTVPPLEATRRGTRIHGRGSCDTKGSGAAMLWALHESTRSTKQKLPHHIGIFFTVDEEAGMTGAAALAQNTLRNWNTTSAPIRGVIVGEPTNMQPVVAHNGVIRWTTATRGVAAHSSDPSRGRSAISAMLRVVESLEKDYAPRVNARTHPLTGGAAVSVNVIRGGTQVNIIPERCEIEVDRRLAPQESPDAVLRERDELFATLLKVAPLEIEQVGAPYILPPVDFSAPANRALHAWLAPALTEARINATPRGARYVTNASHYASIGLPVLVMGPGDIAQAHTADEWLDLAQLDLAAHVFAALMRRP